MQAQTHRSYPRMHLRNVTGELVLADRRRLSVAVQGISPDGVEIRCGADTVGDLQSKAATDTGAKDQVFLRFNLPHVADTSDLLTGCRISSFASNPDGSADVELEFLYFGGAGQDNLDGFFQVVLEPAH